MRTFHVLSLCFFLLSTSAQAFFNQKDSVSKINTDSVTQQVQELKKLLQLREKQRIEDSIKRTELVTQLELVKASDQLKRSRLLQQIKEAEQADSLHKFVQMERIDALKHKAKGYPVNPFGDTLFMVYSKIGPLKPAERAANISNKIRKLNGADFLYLDSIQVVPSENALDIVYFDNIIMTVTDWDALWFDTGKDALAKKYVSAIKSAVLKEHEKYSLLKVFLRFLVLILIVTAVYYILLYLGKVFKFTEGLIIKNKDRFIKGITFRNYVFLSPVKELSFILKANKLLRWVVLLLILYLSFPLIFSLFPFTRTWSTELFNLVWMPVKKIFGTFFSFIPNLITIIVIYFITRYVIRFIKFLAIEISAGKLKISGFHEDWAMPTFGIVKFLLYAFMIVIIFPFLPGSDSPIFKGMSVFLGILFSLGSSSAIANMVAGLVITYMRPFKIGDRIKIGEISGDVIDKTLLVTRIRTIKNEEVTLPNSNVLTNHTTNYTSLSRDQGLIIHSTVTIGYNVPWRTVHQLLVNAALATEGIEKEPVPFVLQTSLNDFYVSYQVNAYTKIADKQAATYSQLHQNIQDKFNEAGVEIMSPHYNAIRDGNSVSIPEDYVPYRAPSFRSKDKPDENDKS